MNELLSTQGLTEYQNSLRALGASGTSATEVDSSSGAAFGNYLSDALENLNQKTATMDQDTIKMITGDESDLGNIMIRMTVAQLALQTAVTVRNKCLEAYNDVKNMQF